MFNLSRRTWLFLLGSTLATKHLQATILKKATRPATHGTLSIFPPTRQQVLDGSVRIGIFMDTGTGRPESGMFGNVRRDSQGRPRFHEGLDIAPFQPWSRKRLPKDHVKTVADGTLVYLNKTPSLYGNYAVMLHDVPGVGTIYTLYAHLRQYSKNIKLGMQLKHGTTLGIMGNIPDIPVARSHLHFEIGFMMNRSYPLIDGDHGILNGSNLYGFNPCHAFQLRDTDETFYLLRYLQCRKPAFILLLDLQTLPDYFKRYCYVWQGDPFRPGLVEIAFSAEGFPLNASNCYGYPPTVKKPFLPSVVSCDMKEVEKGRPYVRRRGADFILTERGEVLLLHFLLTPDGHYEGEPITEIQ